MRALAIVCAFNEAGIIGWTVRHLIREGVSVHVIDTGSTDDTVRVAKKAGAAIERYNVKDGRVSWRSLLTRVEELSAGTFHDWIMHCDADEIRRGPGITLRDMFSRFDAEGYNAAEFEVYTFHPTDNGYDGTQDPEKYFRYYTRDHMNERIGQVKAWKNLGRVELAWSGGHRIKFNGKDPRVHPCKLISKHYPIRSQQQGERKVFSERRGRWSDPEIDWHIQYQGIEPGHNFLKRPEECMEWK